MEIRDHSEDRHTEISEYNQGNLNKMNLYDLTENYEDMMKCLLNLSSSYEVSIEEIEIITRCIKSLVGYKRKQYRKIISLINKETLNNNKNEILLLNILKDNLSLEIINLSQKVIEFSKNFLITIEENSNKKKLKLFFVKNIADHYRYIFELNEKEEHKLLASDFYNQALLIAETGKFLATDIIYLTFFLNYTVFLYEVMENKSEAIKRSKIVLNAALKDTEEISENCQRDIILLCQLIKDNLALWRHNNI